MSDSAVFFFANPNFDTLQCVTLVRGDDEVSIETSRQEHIYKARELIFRERQVIATPVLQVPYSVLAITQKSLLDSEPFRQRLESMRLRVCSRQRVLPREFQSCLSYTMLALLAPAWNRVGPYLCQGREFLVAAGVIPAIEWQILATETKTELTLAAGGIRLRHMTLADLLRVSKIAHSTLVELCVKEVPIEPMQCFVLPSMRIATAIAVSFKVFSDCPYGSFQELKKFWKNTYGYRIPDETERTMIYVKVRFRTSRDRCYVYPILCVRPREPQPLARINPYPIIGAFLQCVKLRMGQVCGEPFPMVSRSPAFPTPQLRWTAKDAQTGIDTVSWTPRPSSHQVPYRPKVSFEAQPVTVFIGDVEVVPESDVEAENTQHSKLSSTTKLKPCFQPKQSRVHYSHVGACSRAQPRDASGCSRERMDNPLPSPQVHMNASATAFPAVVEWLNSCEFPVAQKANNELTARKTVSFREAPRATCTDTMSYMTQTVASAGTVRSEQTLQGQQPGRAAVNAHKTRGVAEGKIPEEAGSKPTNHMTITHPPQKTSTQLGASAPALTVHYASSGGATKSSMSGHSGHANAAQQAQKMSAHFEDKWSSFTTPAQTINDASRCKNPGSAKGRIPAQAKTAQLAGGTSKQLGKMWGGSTTTAQNIYDFAQRTTSPASGGRLPTQAKTDQPTPKASFMLLKGMWDGAISSARNTPTFNNAGKPCPNVQTARQPQLQKLGQTAVKPYLPPSVKQVTETLSLNKANSQQRITFDRHSAAQPRPAPPTKHKMASLSIIKTKDEKRITFERHTSQKRVGIGAAKTLACAVDKAGQDEKASFSCVANTSNVDEDPAVREIASQPLQSAPKEADDLPTLCSTQLEQRRKAPRSNASTRKCWTIAEVDSLLRDKKFDMLNKVNSAVLLAWLCHNNVPCNIKTKKSDILFKITQHAAKG
ncbi:uncharacterized protein LOC119381671 [Rhipicephalus sanguineus]|uniref:uncharacterized protein LOC119381671 n=1 Tax=Rhipicephalus sanguineus TaxID=34632 RepID=UPI0018951216|nr:uncharacterized protein LOC119381671 [Rhipicephalus sanguineus]